MIFAASLKLLVNTAHVSHEAVADSLSDSLWTRYNKICTKSKCLTEMQKDKLPMRKNCKERRENQLTMLKAVVEIPGQSAKGKEQRRRYAPALWH